MTRNTDQRAAHAPAPQASGRYLRLPEVKNQTGLGKTTIYRLIGEQQFPKPVRISARAVAWRESAIAAWMAEREQQSQAA